MEPSIRDGMLKPVPARQDPHSAAGRNGVHATA